MKLRIGTRASKLALWQAEWVAEALRRHGHDVELIHIRTEGDRTSQSLRAVGGRGVFTKAIQQALLANQVDVAVHSLKDLPTEPVPGLCLAAVPPREDTSDCLITRHQCPFTSLPAQARIGTGSLRRAAQLLHWRHDVVIADIRGNVDTRLQKVHDGELDAIILARAGLNRLQLTEHIAEVLPTERMLPAVGQGALGLECRQEDAETHQALRALDDNATHRAVLAERHVLRHLMAGCLAPVAAVAVVGKDQLTLRARVLSPDGRQCVEAQQTGPDSDPIAVAEAVTRQLRDAGAEELIALARH
ncbi:MAG: porphobilinogen deaminase [Pirellulaceae bacterium]|nr:MAG: porphobilinogen deaminase [Pirellulaceae bacterium]